MPLCCETQRTSPMHDLTDDDDDDDNDDDYKKI